MSGVIVQENPASLGCENHLDHAGSTCPECSEPVDPYGNTAYAFKYCSFPDCGCDGARLCMAGEASDFANRANGEGMWNGGAKNPKYVGELMNGLKERGK